MKLRKHRMRSLAVVFKLEILIYLRITHRQVCGGRPRGLAFQVLNYVHFRRAVDTHSGTRRTCSNGIRYYQREHIIL